MKRLKQCFLLAGLMLASLAPVRADVTTDQLRCEYLTNPLGLDTLQPRLSWVMLADARGEKQTAYQILVASSPAALDANQGDLWDSGQVTSDENAQIAYAGKTLVSRETCFWKVRVWNRQGVPGDWSAPAQWQMGLLQPSDWQAQWITSHPDEDQIRFSLQQATYEAVDGSTSLDVTPQIAKGFKGGSLVVEVTSKVFKRDPAPGQAKQLRIRYSMYGTQHESVTPEDHYLTLPDTTEEVRYMRKAFNLAQPVKSAVLYVTALGLYETHLNGQRVGDHVLAPDWTDFNQRVRYQAYDVTSLVKAGPNALGAWVADGWYSGHLGNKGYEFFGKVPSLLAQLEVTYADGTTERIVSDGSWKSHTSPIRSADFMLGENYDARLELPGWDAPGLAETGWTPVAVRTEPARLLQAQVMEPVRATQELKSRRITEPQPGHWVYDLGQNMVGGVRLKISAPAGTKVTLHHAEMLNPDGTVYLTNLRGAPATDTYTCKGGGVEVWQPQFTFHGFRYVELTGLPDRPADDAVTGVVIGSDNPRVGSFACSDARINQLQSNIQWGQRGNYISVPTDCPQRDERLGWMGDAQVFVRTATYNADVAAFFNKWLVDVDDAQAPDGAFSNVSPNTGTGSGVPAWGDAGVICPWTIYEVYGDKRELAAHLPAMIRWVEFYHRETKDLLYTKNFGFGDWLSSLKNNTSKELIGTAYFAYSTHLLAKSCAALGRTEAAAKYDQLFQDIKAAFNRRYVQPDGHIEGGTQCGYVMALKFELLPENLRAAAAQYLVADIKARGDHLSTGFVGVSYLLPELNLTGQADTAGRLLLQDTFPSWLFSVKHGATTIWERWDGWTPEKGFQNPGMNSFNHYSLGSCGEYLFGYVGGIRPASPGYKRILIAPTPGNGLTWAKTSYDSINGRIATDWKLDGHRLALEVVIPANTTATLRVPARNRASLTEGGQPVDQVADLRVTGESPGVVELEAGAGTYRFASETGL